MDEFFSKIHGYIFVQLFLGVILLWFLSKALDFSLNSLITGLIKEINSLRSGKLDRGAVNIFGCTLIFVLIVIFSFKNGLGDLIRIENNVNQGGVDEANVAPLGFFVLSVTLILSIIFTSQ